MTTSKPERAGGPAARQAGNLQQACEHSLQQCQQLLTELSAADYANRSRDTASIGAHVRHILERYQCFLTGLPEGCVNYDARSRDRSLEADPRSAAFALASIQRRLRALSVDSRPVLVREAVLSGAPNGAAEKAESTVERELLALVSHTTHHLAMIAMLARPLGYDFGANFGKAASTIIHEQRSSSRDSATD